ncbi:MAG: hypothetical protein GX600_03665 [Dehalococcoidia bacterium]|nr:hypothetical protein [Dehalococcoidia bacterium]
MAQHARLRTICGIVARQSVLAGLRQLPAAPFRAIIVSRRMQDEVSVTRRLKVIRRVDGGLPSGLGA